LKEKENIYAKWKKKKGKSGDKVKRKKWGGEGVTEKTVTRIPSAWE